MSHLAAFLMVTIDGRYEGEAGAFDFWRLDEDFDQFSASQLEQADTLLFGRRTYEAMASYWPTSEAADDDRVVAHHMNTKPKLVLSTSLGSTTWTPSRLVTTTSELGALLNRGDDQVLLLGSPTTVARLLTAGLVDELRLMVNPVILGAGPTPTWSADAPAPLDLTDVRRVGQSALLTFRRP